MAISPLNPAPHAAIAVPAAPLPEPSVSVTPAAQAASQGDTGSATSEQSRQGSPLPLEKALEEINRSMQAWSTSLRFDIDPEVKRVVVSIIDTETGDVVRTIPNEVILRIAKMLINLQGQAVTTSA